MSPSSKGLISGIPWQMTSFTDLKKQIYHSGPSDERLLTNFENSIEETQFLTGLVNKLVHSLVVFLQRIVKYNLRTTGLGKAVVIEWRGVALSVHTGLNMKQCQLKLKNQYACNYNIRI